MTRHFFSIVGITSAVGAGLLLLVAIVLTAMALTAFLSKSDREIRSPQLQLEGYVDEHEEKQEPVSAMRSEASQGDRSPPVPSDRQAELQRLASEAMQLMDDAAKALGHEGINMQYAQIYVDEASSALTDELTIEFLQQLIRELGRLVEEPAIFGEATADSERATTLPGFLDWYIDQYFDRLDAEKDRLAKLELEQAGDRTRALLLLAVAGGAFGLFVLLTLVLLLVHIERNTRSASTATDKIEINTRAAGLALGRR